MNNNKILKIKDDQIIELIVKNDTLYEENEELRSRIDKAIELIEKYSKITACGVDISTNVIKELYEFNFKEHILDILEGKDE